MDNISEQFNYIINKNIGWVHTNKYILPVLSLFLGMYAALARPTLPNFIIKLFENPVFRLVMISYIIYRGNQDPQLSLMIATAFLITMHMINKQKVEKFSTTKNAISTVQDVSDIINTWNPKQKVEKFSTTENVISTVQDVSDIINTWNPKQKS